MKIRITGTPDEVTAAADILRSVFDVVSESKDYSRRNDTQVNRYIEAEVMTNTDNDDDIEFDLLGAFWQFVERRRAEDRARPPKVGKDGELIRCEFCYSTTSTAELKPYRLDGGHAVYCCPECYPHFDVLLTPIVDIK